MPYMPQSPGPVHPQQARDHYADQLNQMEMEALGREGRDMPLAPEPGLIRTIVKLPKGKWHGSPEFWDNVRAHQASFAWTEANVTPGPTGSLQPVPFVQQKEWYNTYIYVPEQRPCLERHYMERFIQGPNGEWIDTVRAQRMVQYIDNKIKEEEEEKHMQYLVENGIGIEKTHYTDSYDGQRLVTMQGQLWGEQDLERKYKPNRSDWKDVVDDAQDGFDFANLRIPWPFGRPNRNKKINTHTYEWFDRRNMHIESDRSYDILELDSAYVDAEMYSKWRAKGGDGPVDFMADLYDYTTSVDGTDRY